MITIKTMTEIPETCGQCPLSVSHFGKIFCPVIAGQVSWYVRDKGCPLVTINDPAGVSKKGDLISRQAAIDALDIGCELLRRVLDDTDVVGVERAKYEWGLGLIESYIADMKVLPSAQLEIIRCKDCKHFIRDITCVGGHYDGCDAWTDNGNEIEVAEDDFCSYAERRTDGTEDTD